MTWLEEIPGGEIRLEQAVRCGWEKESCGTDGVNAHMDKKWLTVSLREVHEGITNSHLVVRKTLCHLHQRFY
ncbi:hypothetical protein E2C01_053933 [Portunus trituberculatus]|uniref:Uncharacterized protein n=1 Tax=Portunus trituberculatus TaxID=210409 RepID=A0A5B7GTL9_PORTR|nr:hypothetical protein [Portunus trituberculatus]